jgi:hypothetical protein
MYSVIDKAFNGMNRNVGTGSSGVADPATVKKDHAAAL